MLELTEEQHQALKKCPGTPLTVIDSHTRRLYALVSGEQYERFSV